MKELGIKTGEKLLALARKAVADYFKNILTEEELSEEDIEGLDEKRGIFVTIKRYPEGNLRGCIGFPEAVYPLYTAVIQAARSSAFEDPRFTPLTTEELTKVVFYVTVLTPLELLPDAPEERINSIKIGCDGLLIRRGIASGLLLPEVAVEWNWTPQKFMEEVSLKAGLSKDAWRDPEACIFRFRGEVFFEESPEGRVLKKE